MADHGIGDPQDTQATDSTSSWTVISLLKGIMGNGGGGGGAVTIADAADVAEGAVADAAVAAGATGTISAKLRAISRDIVANIVLKAGSAIIGQVGVDQTTPGTTDSVTVKASSGIGSLTEVAPATDTASSGLNGRLQRIAQNITTLISSVLQVVGNVASAATDSGNPVKTGGKYNSTKPTFTNGQRGDTQIEANGAASVALYGKVTTAGDTATMLDSAGNTRVSLMAFNSNAQLSTNVPSDVLANSNNGLHVLSMAESFNGTTWDRLRNMSTNTVLASAARTATVSTDVTNYNGKTFTVILNITATPNNAETLTVQIRGKDSISSNYSTILTSAAIVASVINGALPNTTRYVIALGVTVTSNVSASDALMRTMNVNVVHSAGSSWTYSVSADIGV